MRALCAGQDHFRFGRLRGGRRQQAHFDALVSHELQTGAPVFSAAPILPEERLIPNHPRIAQRDSNLWQ
jgi:hypothetical protein